MIGVFTQTSNLELLWVQIDASATIESWAELTHTGDTWSEITPSGDETWTEYEFSRI